MKIFLKKILILSISIIIVIFSYNICFDRFSVIWGNVENIISEPNQRYIKTKHLLKNHQKYDYLFLGNSRVSFINVKKFNPKAYNFASSMSIPEESYSDLKKIFESGGEFKTIFIGLDNLSYSQRPEDNSSNLLRKEYHKLNILYYLFNFKIFSDIKFSIENYNTRPKIIYDVYESGTQKAHLMEKYIEANPNEHLNKLEFKKSYIPKAPPYRIDETIKAVKDIVELCNKNNTKLVVFINPMHINTFNSINDVYYELFISELAKITDILNFAGKNEITTNNLNYYEISHYREHVGDYIISEIEKKLYSE